MTVRGKAATLVESKRWKKSLAEALAMDETDVRKWLGVTSSDPVFVVKGWLPSSKGVPTADDLADDNIVRVAGVTTLQQAIDLGGCSGNIFVIVWLAGEHAWHSLGAHVLAHCNAKRTCVMCFCDHPSLVCRRRQRWRCFIIVE